MRQRRVKAFEVRLGESLVGRVPVPGHESACTQALAGQLGVTAWTSGPNLDLEDDNDG